MFKSKMTIKTSTDSQTTMPPQPPDDLTLICISIRANDLEGLKEILEGKKARKMIQKTKMWREDRGAIWNKAPLHLAAVNNNIPALKVRQRKERNLFDTTNQQKFQIL